MKKRVKRLYVWNNVLSDYTPGIAFAMAYNVEEARRLLKQAMPEHNHHEIEQEPTFVHTRPACDYVYGGG